MSSAEGHSFLGFIPLFWKSSFLTKLFSFSFLAYIYSHHAGFYRGASSTLKHFALGFRPQNSSSPDCSFFSFRLLAAASISELSSALFFFSPFFFFFFFSPFFSFVVFFSYGGSFELPAASGFSFSLLSSSSDALTTSTWAFASGSFNPVFETSS